MDRLDRPDDSSIRPVSSLRSRFETLGQSHGAGLQPQPASSVRHQSTANPAWPVNVQRPETPSGESNGQEATLPVPRKPRPDVLKSRPTSTMFLPPPEPAAPTVTVESPRSPPKSMSVDLWNSSANTPLQPLTPHRTSDSPTKAHARTISRAPTPGLEARMAAFLQHASEAPKKMSPGGSPLQAAVADVPVSAGKQFGTQPPTVNRASKPQIPTKPAALARKTSGLMAPEQTADLTDRSASPFSTPPSSGANSPDLRRNSSPPTQGGVYRARTESSAASVLRDRTSSDASWVQRIRGESNASTADRARAGSGASFVETSQLPDNWLPPPTHHAVASRRALQPNGLSRAPTMPLPMRSAQASTSPDLDSSPERGPRLPARPELQARSRRTSPTKPRSGRNSPTKLQHNASRRSVDGLTRARAVTESTESRRIPAAAKPALNQGFHRSVSPGPPQVPVPRRSVDRRREMPMSTSAPLSRAPMIAGHSRDNDEDVPPPEVLGEFVSSASGFPDATRANRRPPRFKQRPHQIPTDYDTRLFAVSGEYVCTTGYITKAWNMRTGEQLLNMEHREGVKVLSIVFKPMPGMQDEGRRLWLGTSIGEIHEVDIMTQSLLQTRANAHGRHEVIRLFRHGRDVWSLDDSGDLNVWRADQNKVLSLDSRYTTWRVPRGHTFSIACGEQLWLATGKDIRVFLPGATSDAAFYSLRSPLSQPTTGDVTAGAVFHGSRSLVYFGHSDGKVSIYNRENFTCTGVVSVSVYKISSLASVGYYLWAGYSTGMAYVYDVSTTPWTVKKDWQAHDKQICSIIADPSAFWTMGRLNVVTLGLDNQLRIWDGLLEDDWLLSHMDHHDSEYCSFREITAAVLTWNAGAVKPTYLQHTKDDSNFFRDYLTSNGAPDIFVFGFQELVDLEDKKVTAKSFFKSKKKDGNEQEHMSHQYRAWRDHLTRCIDESVTSSDSYSLLHTASMVGLFTCIFVKTRDRPRIKHVHTSEIKRGMGGRYGNKGALVLRMVLDDSSLCFINCHLAAGQTQTMHRNNDIAAILETQALPPYPLNDREGARHGDVFATGGDGSMILDHEICILNGDLNYRIDTMGRDIVVKHVQRGDLAKLLERDQLLLSRKKNPGFRLRAFQESAITFAPTYKYNVRTDEYDTSEKRRAPAWCDRILYRGVGKVKMEEYRRWDQIRVSDHRPVSGRLRIRVKTVDANRREVVWQKCLSEFEAVRARITQAEQLEYFTNILGFPYEESLATVRKGPG